jgi:phosphoribosyl-dephospho-CoA transferase
VSKPLPRHAMVTAAPEAWRAMLAARPDLAVDPLVAGWADAGRPLVARRAAEGDPPHLTPLGLPLPPAQGKQRIALSLPAHAILDFAAPPILKDAAPSAPGAWRPAIDELVRLDPQTRVFGSLAWSHLTGLAYLGEGSDLDLLWDLPAPADLDRLLAGIAAVDRRAPMRIDGEILGSAGGVNWRELLAGGEVLVKGRTGVRMMSRPDYLAGRRA